MGQTFVNSYQWACCPTIGTAGRGATPWPPAARRPRGGAVRPRPVVHLIGTSPFRPTSTSISGPPAGSDYEDYCSSLTSSEYDSALPLPPLGAAIPMFVSPYHAWRATAEASFARNRYPGDLHDTAAAHGILAQMYPSISWSWFSEAWSIDDPPVGDLGSDFQEEEPGWFYFKNAVHPAAVDKMAWDAGDRPAPPTACQRRVWSGVRPRPDPAGVLHAAGVIQLFLDTAGPPPPTSRRSTPAHR
jgi:hypothetical protein